MTYTVWSLGRLVGHTDLEFSYGEGVNRDGFLRPTELGKTLMPVATGVEQAIEAIREGECSRTAVADLASAYDRCAALALELRGPDETVIPTVSIGVRDIDVRFPPESNVIDDDQWSDQLDDAARAEFDASVEDDRAMIEESFAVIESLQAGGALSDCASEEKKAWLEELESTRYHIHVVLVDPSSVPCRE